MGIKLCIFGSRDSSPSITSIQYNLEALLGHRLDSIEEIVCGMAKGADTAGLQFAKYLKYPVKMFPADWKKHGKIAGILRNQEMADYCDEGLGFWRGQSSGTANMVANMVLRCKPVGLVHE